MRVKMVSLMILLIIFVGVLTRAFDIQPVKSDSAIWTVDDDGTADYERIQDAVGNASEGDTIFVYSGAYFEHVIVNKTLSLIGERKETTIIEGEGKETVLHVTANRVTIRNFTVRYGGDDYFPHDSEIRLSRSNGSVIADNILYNVFADAMDGIFLYHCSNNSIIGNKIYEHKGAGIRIDHSCNNTFADNNIHSNGLGIDFISKGNNNTFADNNIHSNGLGIDFISKGNNNTFADNNIYLNSLSGIAIRGSHNNTFSGNNIYSNRKGAWPSSSNYNLFFHNNFIDNWETQMWSTNSLSILDSNYPGGGNYWSEYASVDLFGGPYQNESGSDRIGDVSYVVDENNTDRYPLMAPYNPAAQREVLYDELLRRYNESLSSYSELHAAHNSLNSTLNNLNATYNDLKLQQEETKNQLNNIRNLMYVFITATVILIATTVYFAKRKPRTTH